jgi:hypothetical protein
MGALFFSYEETNDEEPTSRFVSASVYSGNTMEQFLMNLNLAIVSSYCEEAEES